MRDRNGQKENNSVRGEKRQKPKSRINRLHPINGRLGPISRFISKISKAPDSTGISVRSNEKTVLDKTWLEPIDETSPKMRMAGPEAEKKEVSQLSDNLGIFKEKYSTDVLPWEQITELLDRHMDEKEIEILSRKR